MDLMKTNIAGFFVKLHNKEGKEIRVPVSNIDVNIYYTNHDWYDEVEFVRMQNEIFDVVDLNDLKNIQESESDIRQSINDALAVSDEVINALYGI